MSKGAEQPIAVIGAGSWGTALAIQFARGGRPTLLWGRNARHLATLARERCNAVYLPDAPFPEALRVVPALADAVSSVRDVLVCVPSHAFRATLEAIKPHLAGDARLCWATKGLGMNSGLLPHQVAAEILGASLPTAVLSGPTFAGEVGAGLPTAMTVASETESFAGDLATSISGAGFRAYTSTDITGVEVGGAVKNVLAIGAGISDGLGFGANTRVALITRGLSEMMRLGIALGARQETFMGLAGMGDLILTCTDNQSRNRRMGLALAAGQSVAEAEREIRQVVEGVQAAAAIWQLAQRLKVDMPITEQVYCVLYEKLSPAEAVRNLMGRQLRTEHD